MPDPVISTAGAPVTQNEYGFWVDANGAVAATDPQGNPQETPGQAANPQSKIFYDAEKKLDYNMVNGKKKYISPESGTPDPTGKAAEGPGKAPGGSFLTNRGTWNADTGSWDTGTNWGNVLSLVVAGALTAGAASALMSGATVAEVGVAPEVASDVSTAVAADTAAGATVLTPEIAASTVAAAAPEAAVGGLEVGAEGVVEGGALPGGTAIADGETTALRTAGGGGALTTAEKMLANKGVSSLGNAISQASSGAGNTRRADADTNISGQSAFETELLNRSKLETEQRRGALQDVYLQSRAQNPSVSPYNPVGAPKQSANYGATLSGLEQQGMNRLKTAPQYGTDTMPALPPFKPTTQGTLEKVGSIAGPTISTAKSLWDLYNSSQGGA